MTTSTWLQVCPSDFEYFRPLFLNTHISQWRSNFKNERGTFLNITHIRDWLKCVPLQMNSVILNNLSANTFFSLPQVLSFPCCFNLHQQQCTVHTCVYVHKLKLMVVQSPLYRYHVIQCHPGIIRETCSSQICTGLAFKKQYSCFHGMQGTLVSPGHCLPHSNTTDFVLETMWPKRPLSFPYLFCLLHCVVLQSFHSKVLEAFTIFGPNNGSVTGDVSQRWAAQCWIES